jgi:hypothetical protein
MTCERFIATKQFVTCVKREMMTRTAVVDVKITAVAVADGSDVKVC